MKKEKRKTVTEKKITAGLRASGVIALVRSALGTKDDLYVVGGSIRDLAFDKVPSEFDFVSRRPCAAARAVAAKAGSRAFKLGKGRALIYRIPMSEGNIDFSPLREATIEKNLSKRDFTMNSLAAHLKDFSLVAPSEGLSDIVTNTLRRGYRRSFSDDPLRIVKGYRMRSAFPFLEWDKETREDCMRLASEIRRVPAERILLEMTKILGGKTAARALREMAEDGVLQAVFPELKEIDGFEQEHPHRTDVLSHTLDTLDLLDENLVHFEGSSLFHHQTGDLVKLRLALLFHDAGKARRFSREGGRIRFFGHEKESARISAGSLGALRFPNSVIRDVSSLCALHMRPLLLHAEGSPSTPAIRRLIRDAGSDIHLLMMMSLLDFSSMERTPEELESFWDFCRRVFDIVEKEGEKIISPPKLVDGLEALAILSLERPGPLLGKALLALADAQAGGEVGSREEAVAFLEDYGKKIPKD